MHKKVVREESESLQLIKLLTLHKDCSRKVLSNN